MRVEWEVPSELVLLLLPTVREQFGNSPDDVDKLLARGERQSTVQGRPL